MRTMTIGHRKIGDGAPCFIIAEAGSNHNCDLATALRLIDVAVEAGADCVKFQTYTAETLYSRFAPRLTEMEGRSRAEETPFELIKRIELPWEWHERLVAHAKAGGIIFLSTPFGHDAVDLLHRLGVPAFKIASYEIVDLPLLRRAARTGKPIVLSTGNSSLADVEEAMATLQEAGATGVVLLHCVSQYPAKVEDVNLRAMVTLRQAFDVPVGFSDHTMDSVSSLGAVALGACVLEKHFTLDRSHPGPDHPASLEPEELRRFVQDVRRLEAALGSPVKRVQVSEDENHRLGRRSLHARVRIPKGATITEEMLTVKRPGLGIKPVLLPVVVGRIARRDIEADEWITWDMI